MFRKPWTSRRSAVLLGPALFAIVWGVALRRTHLPQATLSNGSYAFELASPQTWGWIWLGAAAIALAGVAFKSDWWAFVLPAALGGAWTGFYAVAWYVHGGSGWILTAAFAAITWPTVVCAGWPDPPDPDDVAHRAVLLAQGDDLLAHGGDHDAVPGG